MSDRDQSVAKEAYSEAWIQSAWGDEANRELLTGSEYRPRPRVLRALDLCRLRPGLRLLDIACGRGEVPMLTARAGCIGLGLDYSPDAIGFARTVASRHAAAVADRMQLMQGDATRLPLANASVDRVTMLDIIEHLHPPQLEAMLTEAIRVLRPGGYVVLHTLPNRWVYDVAYPLLHAVYPRVPRDPRGPIERSIHVNEQSLASLSAMLCKIGVGHRLWLEQHLAAQARWNQGRDSYRDTRDVVYPLLGGWLGRALEWASATPLKLVLCNDIYGVFWNPAAAPADLPKVPRAWIERACIRALAGGAPVDVVPAES